ncbi:MAG: type I secretion system permease/ATPase [Methylohalobius sp. ZOD2]
MREIFKKCRPFFIYTGIFSFSSNLLLLTIPLFMLQVLDRVLHSRSNETLFMLGMIALFALSIEGALEALRSRLLGQFSDTLERQIREPAFKALLTGNNDVRGNGHALNDLATLQTFLTGRGIKALFDLPWIPVFLFVLYLFHPLLCAIAVTGALILFGLAIVEEKLSAKTQLHANTQLRKSNDFINNALRNAEIVTALRMDEPLYHRWRHLNEHYLSASGNVTRKSSKIVALSGFVRNALTIASMATAAALAINVETISPGIMIAATIILGRTLAPIMTVIGTWKSLLNAREAYVRLDALLNTQDTRQQGLKLPAPKGRLSVNNLVFFLSKDKPILKGVSFDLLPGESLGIIGASASGKTSLARLLTGIHHPTDGKIRLDDADVFYWSRNGLADHIGYLPQNVQLFSGTVAENIARMADPHAHADKVIEAAKRTRIHDMILRLPKGYDTEIGEGGGLLSGGQRQLIGLARAVYGDPKFLVLDEPNANLDGPSELNLLSLIDEFRTRGITLVIISHKPSIMRGVDQLLVLKEGRQEAYGPRDEVMQYLNGMNKKSGAASDRRVQALNRKEG